MIRLLNKAFNMKPQVYSNLPTSLEHLDEKQQNLNIDESPSSDIKDQKISTNEFLPDTYTESITSDQDLMKQIKTQNQNESIDLSEQKNKYITAIHINSSENGFISENIASVCDHPDNGDNSIGSNLLPDEKPRADPKPEDYELLAKLEEANRLIEADCKSLSFSAEPACSKSSSSSSTACQKNASSSRHKKSLSSSSTASSSSTSNGHKKSNSVSSIISNLVSRQNSLSSEHSECSHKIGVPCSCSSTPDIIEEGDKELLGDSWSTWRQIADNWEEYKNRKSFIKEMVRKGIPPHFRGLVWPYLSGGSDSIERSNYKIYLRRSSKFEKFIRRDVSRTYPNHDMFRDLEGPGQESLFNIIKAYSIIDPEVGYCQGSAFVAGLLLMQMPEEDAFAVFVQVMQTYGLRELYKPSMAKIELCIYQLECMIQDKNASLYQHFQAHGIFASSFATQWFLSLFATSLPLALSCRVMDIFLLEGMDSIMTLSYAMLEISSQELMKRDMEEMIKLLGKELPQQLEENPDLLFQTSFRVKFCPKKMKRLEKDYTLIKTKENEDNIERKRLKTENKLLRQRIERLEEETLTLADRLVQDQIKYANQEEELYSLRRKLSLSLQGVQSVTSISCSATSSPDVVATDGSSPDAKELQKRIDELVNREVSHLAEMHDLKMRIAELEKKTLESQASDVTDLQQQLVLSKLREAEMNTSAKELEQRVLELDKYCQKHQELINFGENKPKVQKAKIQLLTEEMLSVKLRETNLSKELMELKLKIVDLETKNHVNERLIGKLNAENASLRDSLSKFESNKISWEDEMRCLKRQLSSAESKQQNDDLMSKIKDAETSQYVAEFKQKIAQLEIQNQELLTAEKLYKGATQGDNITDIDAKIEELHQQIMHLREKRKLHQSLHQKNGWHNLETLTRNYSIESLSDMEDFDAVKFKLKGSTSSISKPERGRDLHDLEDARKNEESIASGSSSMSLDGYVRPSSSDSDYFGEDILAGCFNGHEAAKRASSNPDILLDSVFNDSEPFVPVLQSSPANLRNSCHYVVRPEVDRLPIPNLKSENDGFVDSMLVVSPLGDPDKTPTNEIEHDSGISDRFMFDREQMTTHQNEAKISQETFPDILSDPNTLNEIVRNNMSSLIAGLDLPGDKCISPDDKSSKRSDVKVASDRNLSLSLDILSAV